MKYEDVVVGLLGLGSPSVRRAWIEMEKSLRVALEHLVALREEGVD